MCSICGVVDLYNRDSIRENLIREMGQTLIHRGPDQQDIFINDKVAFEHNRLAVMDIENGLQPMTRQYRGRKYTIIYNGEIYNTVELRKEIEKEGIRLETNCDTEVVLYMYILHGKKCPKKLNGIFAFGVWDENNQSVYIARDRLGVKPLFYTQVGSTFMFASEVKALLKHPKVDAKIDQQGLWQMLYLTPIKKIGTSIFQNIYEVPPAYCGYYDGQNLKLEAYWHLEAKPFIDSEEEAVDYTRYLVSDAICRQLQSDVPLATFLSGGLDSSIISAVGANDYKEKGKVLSTYSFEYAGNKTHFKEDLFQPESDDAYAAYLAHYLQTHHTVLTAHEETLVALLEEAMFYRDLPGMADIDSSLLFYCKAVKENHTVVLSGECADEIFGGYPWFYRSEMLQKAYFPWIHSPHIRADLFKKCYAKQDEGYEFAKSVYLESLRECPILESDDEVMKRSRYATWLSVSYFMTSLLERKDRMSMANGLEVRVPFADHRILEYVFNVPMSIKFKNHVEKALLREAMKDYLPEKILYRKKSPYPKTHHPDYEEKVTQLIRQRITKKDSILKELLDTNKVEEMLSSKGGTWFGQLMSKPQLLAWLLQLETWFENYNVKIIR